MDNPRPVGRSKRVGDDGTDMKALSEGEGGSVLALRHVLPLEPLHGHVRLPFVELAECDESHDRRVLELGQDAAFSLEPRFFPGVDAGDGDNLQGDRLTCDPIGGPIHDPDAAAPHLLLDEEPTAEQLLGHRERHAARRSRPTMKSSVLTLRVPSGRINRSRPKILRSSARA